MTDTANTEAALIGVILADVPGVLPVAMAAGVRSWITSVILSGSVRRSSTSLARPSRRMRSATFCSSTSPMYLPRGSAAIRMTSSAEMDALPRTST